MSKIDKNIEVSDGGIIEETQDNGRRGFLKNFFGGGAAAVAAVSMPSALEKQLEGKTDEEKIAIVQACVDDGFMKERTFLRWKLQNGYMSKDDFADQYMSCKEPFESHYIESDNGEELKRYKDFVNSLKCETRENAKDQKQLEDVEVMPDPINLNEFEGLSKEDLYDQFFNSRNINIERLRQKLKSQKENIS